jgi:hypothetical protein
MTSSECGNGIEPTDGLEREEVSTVGVEDDGSLSLYGNDDLLFCESCKEPLGVDRS